jgi:hypothetical protein
MACVLDHDASGHTDFTTKTNSTATVKVSATGQARFTGARLNSSAVAIQSGDTVIVTFVAGLNILKFTVAVANISDTVVISEICGADSQILEQFPNDPDDPVTGFSVFAF